MCSQSDVRRALGVHLVISCHRMRVSRFRAGAVGEVSHQMKLDCRVTCSASNVCLGRSILRLYHPHPPNNPSPWVGGVHDHFIISTFITRSLGCSLWGSTHRIAEHFGFYSALSEFGWSINWCVQYCFTQGNQGKLGPAPPNQFLCTAGGHYYYHHFHYYYSCCCCIGGV